MVKLLTIGLLVALAVAARASQLGLPSPTIPDCLGVNIHFVGSETNQVNQIADGGFRFIRMDYIWSNVEKQKGVYDFKPYDELLAALKSRNIRPLFILCYGNPLYDEGNGPCTDAGRNAFASFAKAAAAHFKGEGVLWEIWNEPNGANFWRPTPKVEDYVKLARATYAALKEGDPDCTVLAPALAGWDFGYIEAAFKLGLLECTDVISVHPYGSSKPEDAADYYATVRELAATYGPKDKRFPVVSGEWGYSATGGTTVERQGEFLARQFLSNLMNDVRLSIWYDWHDDGPDPNEGEHHFGTVYHQDFSPKPAYLAAKTLTTELAGYSYATRMSLEPGPDYLLLFKKDDDYRLAAWTTGASHRVRIPVDVPKLDVVTLTGERSQIEAKNGIIEIELTGAVKYVEPLAKSRRWAIEAGWKVSARTVFEVDNERPALQAEVRSSNPTETVISVQGKGLKCDWLQTSNAGPSGSSQRMLTSYVDSDEQHAYVTVTLAPPELASPLVRVVELDTSAAPRVDVLPPTNRELVIAVRKPPSAKDKAFSGKLILGNSEGVRLIEESKTVEIRPGEDEAVLRFPVTQQPAPLHSFACKLVDSKGSDVVRVSARRYALVETFADGKVGDEIRKYAVELDGDAKVRAEAKLTYARAPGKAPSGICAKLDYDFDTGWRFVRISPQPAIKIPDRPRSAKLWIKGDGSYNYARLRFTDSGGQTFQPDYRKLGFSNWICATARMTGESAGHWGGKNDGLIHYPISWDTLFLLDSAGGRQTKGTVYLGPVMLCYD